MSRRASRIVLQGISDEFGFTAIYKNEKSIRLDVLIIIFLRICRLLGYGLVNSILVIHYRYNLGWSDQYIGNFISLGLLGNAFISLVVTKSVAYVGQRRMASVGPFFMICAGLLLYFAHNPAWLFLGAVIGNISPIANEVSPYQAVDIAILSQLMSPENRTHVFSMYMFTGAAASSIGALVTGFVIKSLLPYGQDHAYRTVFLVYAGAGVFQFLASLFLSANANPTAPQKKSEPISEQQSDSQVDERTPLIADSRMPIAPSVDEPAKETEAHRVITPRFGVSLVALLCIISAFDTFASAIATPSYLAYDLNERFHPPITLITSTMSAAGMLAGISMLVAGSISRRLGLLPTMLSTHIVAQVFLISFGLVDDLHASVSLLLLRSSFAILELVPRTAYFSALTTNENRAQIFGWLNLARTIAAAAGPIVDGHLAENGLIRWAFISSGIIKLIAYDLGLGLFFLGR